jgi:preprotein translocase subunit SecA
MSQAELITRIKRFKNKLAGSTIEFDLSDYRKTLAEINIIKEKYKELSDTQLQGISLALKEEIQNGVHADELLVKSYALVNEAIRRVLKIDPFDEQIIGAIAMHKRKLIEMQTGEGKTLTAVFTAYLNALSGKGCHILTYNNYLAWRDANWMGPVYKFLSLSVGFVKEGMSSAERKEAYRTDITYLTAKEAGFDYLRDSLCYDVNNIVQRDYSFAIIDEADSIMIDEARIPLIIAGTSEETAIAGNISYAQIAKMINEQTDFEYDHYSRNIYFTDEGIKKAENILHLNNLYDECNHEILTRLYCAIHAEYLLKKDIDYIIKNEKIELVDEFTGRVADKRRWPDGLQEALEEKENIAGQTKGKILNSITLQHFLGLYPAICGMTATAQSAEDEFRAFYNLDITVIPTHRKCIRSDMPDLIFRNRAMKYDALVREIIEVHKTGRPILVGTASVRESAELADMLTKAGIKTEVLNAKKDEFEAKIISRAGKFGSVTISTNMAGRGTDIKLGGEDEKEKEQVSSIGGLYVLGTNKHESMRIDNQLRGRAGRQGDPGSSRFFVSLEDSLCIKYRIEELLSENDLENYAKGIDNKAVTREVNRIQRIVEGQNLEIKKTLCSYSSTQEQQRRIMLAKRKNLLDGSVFIDFLKSEVHSVNKKSDELLKSKQFISLLQNAALLLHDKYWSGYLEAIADIRESIHLSRLGGKDPLTVFRKTTIEMFEKLQSDYEHELVNLLNEMYMKNGNVSLNEIGLRIPSATWTYLVNDNPYEDMGGLNMLGNIGMASNAMLLGPALILFQIIKEIEKFRKKKKARKNISSV